MAKKLTPEEEQFEYGGAPVKKEEVASVEIVGTFGDVKVSRGGGSIKVKVESGDKPFPLEDGDRVATGPNSYVFAIWDHPLVDGTGTSLSLYSNSEVEISCSRGAAAGRDGGYAKINRISLLRGMITFAGTSKIEMKTSLPIRLSYLRDSVMCGIEMRSDGSIAFFRKMFIDIEHTQSRVKSGMLSEETVATREGLYEFRKAEPRYAVLEQIPQFSARYAGGRAAKALMGSGMISEIMEKQKSGQFEKGIEDAKEAQINEFRRQLKEEKYLPKKMAEDYKKYIAEYEESKRRPKAVNAAEEEVINYESYMQRLATEGDKALSQLSSFSLPPPAPLSEARLLKEDKSERRAMSMDDYMRKIVETSKKTTELEDQAKSVHEYIKKREELEEGLTGSLMKSFQVGQEAGKAGKPLMDAATDKATVNSRIEYQKITFNVLAAEKGPQFRMIQSPPGKAYVVIGIKVENEKSASTLYSSPDSEIHLVADTGEVIAPDNYKYETALDKGKPSEGYLSFKVPEGNKRFTLEFGKKTEKKEQVEIRFG